MKKRILTLLSVVAMIIAVIPMSVSAANEQEWLKIANGEGEDINVIDNPTGNLPLGGTYSYENGVLTLTDAVINVNNGNEQGGVEAKGIDLTIKIEGTCSILGLEADHIDNHGIFIENADLTLTGSGKLNIEHTSGGISTENLVIDGVTITVSDVERAVAGKNITFKGASNAKLTAKNNAVDSYGEITFNLGEGGSVDATTEDITGQYAAVVAKDINTIIIAEDNKITTPEDGINYNDTAKSRWYIANADNTPATHAVIEGPVSKTGDSSHIGLFMILGIMALAGACFVYKKRII